MISFRSAGFLLATAIVWLTGPAVHAQDRQKSVLVVYSARRDSPTAITADPVLQQVLDEGLAGNLDYYPEFLDLTRYPDSDYQAAVLNLLHAKYQGRKFDLIVATGDASTDFVARFRGDAVFAGTPIVYSATARSTMLPNATGLVFPLNFRDSLDAALRVQTDAERVVVISGASALDKSYESLARTQFKPLEGRLAFTYLSALPLQELLKQVTTLPPRSLVFFITVTNDGNGQRFLAFETLDQLSAVSTAPIYSWHADAMGHGIVGGRMADTDVLERRTAELALRVLRGENAGAIPVAEIDWSVTEFDARQLQRWGISDSRLPRGSTILYRQPGVWEQYRPYIVGGSLLLVLQSAFIAALLLQRKQRLLVERALRESEERFRLMADTAPVLVWRAGTDKRCDFFNRPWLEFTGRTLEQELGDGWTEGVCLDDLDACLRTYVSAFDARQPFRMEYRLRRADGEFRWLLDTGVPRYGPDGSFAGYIGSCIDLTDRKVAEEALRESQRRHEMAGVAGAAGVWDWNLATNDFYVDPTLKALLGFEDAEISRRPEDWASRVHPQDVGALMAQRQLCMDGHVDAYEVEYRMLHKDGSPRWFLSRGSLMRGADGAPRRIVGTDVDITDRKRSDEQFHLAIEAAPAGMLMIDDGGTIVLVNAQVETLFGYSREELLGKPVALVLPDLLNSRHLDGRGLCGRRKNGSEVPIEIGLNPIQTPQGDFVLASIADITARQQAEREKEDLVDHLRDLAGRLLAAQESERARIARDLHDDTSQQLAGLSISLSALKRRLAGLEGGADLHRDISSLQDGAAALADSVRRLSHDLHPSALEHIGLVAALTSYCDQLSRQQAVNLTFHAPPDFEPIDSAAALCLYRVAQEALRNVAVHSQARNASVRLSRTGDVVELTIADDGRGFEAAKARQSRKGLGLISIGERVRLAGGTSTIVTELEKGTQVRVQIPTSPANWIVAHEP